MKNLGKKLLKTSRGFLQLKIYFFEPQRVNSDLSIPIATEHIILLLKDEIR